VGEGKGSIRIPEANGLNESSLAFGVFAFMTLNIGIHDWQGKSYRFSDILVKHGHNVLPPDANALDCLLIDFDAHPRHEKLIEKCVAGGGKALLYQHGAMPMISWDGLWEPSNRISAFITQSLGSKAVMQMYGYPHPIHAVGWYYGEQRAWSSASKLSGVLFAPWHPHGNGYLRPERAEANRRALDILLTAKRYERFDLTVRHIGTLKQNGLDGYSRYKSIDWQPSNKAVQSSIEAIDNADLVVSLGTFAYLAVSRGIPTVFYGQDHTPGEGYSEDMWRPVKSFELYRSFVRYPYDLEQHGWEAAEEALTMEPLEWRNRFIGPPVDGKHFCELIERLAR
jgi:hypothetical protein